MDCYQTLFFPATAELIEKRSRFLCEISPVTTPEEADAVLAEKRAKYHDARHNCYAYILRTGNIERYSDDGEPQGTAGMPILEILRHAALVDVIAVVTRYFGGTLLGTGGLVRAYSQSTKLAIEAADIQTMALCDFFTLTVPYSVYGKLESLLIAHDVQAINADFTDEVTLSGQIPCDKLENLRKAVTELTGGSVEIAVKNRQYAKLSCR